MGLASGISGLIGTGLSLGTGIYGAIKNAKAGRQYKNFNNQMTGYYTDLKDLYSDEMSKDWMDSNFVQSTLGSLRDNYKKALNTTATADAKGGATAEEKVAKESALNNNYNDALTKLVGYGDQYKSNLRRDYQGVLSQLGRQGNAYYGGEVKNAQNLMSNSMDAFTNSVSSTDWSKIF